MIAVILGLLVFLTIYCSLRLSKSKGDIWIILSTLFGLGIFILLIIIPCFYADSINKLTFMERTFPSIVVNEVASTDDISVLDKDKLDTFYFPTTYLEVKSSYGVSTTYEASNIQIINMYNRYLQDLRTFKEKDIFMGILIPEIPKYLKPVVLVSK